MHPLDNAAVITAVTTFQRHSLSRHMLRSHLVLWHKLHWLGRMGTICSIPAGGQAADPWRHVLLQLIAELML